MSPMLCLCNSSVYFFCSMFKNCQAASLHFKHLIIYLGLLIYSLFLQAVQITRTSYKTIITYFMTIYKFQNHS